MISPLEKGGLRGIFLKMLVLSQSGL